ncbi:MAG: SnoaL-like domain [Solirubrobacterales bacterium]|nr:SnoaL-like domain [Solirubrobacterales bacterium]
MSANTDAVERFIETFNSQDLDAFEQTLDPEVEIVSGRGPRRGRDEARAWATFKPGGVQQKMVVEGMRESGDRVVALTRRQWYWDATDELASEEEMAHLFTVRGGLVTRWQPFEDRAEALKGFGGA